MPQSVRVIQKRENIKIIRDALQTNKKSRVDYTVCIALSSQFETKWYICCDIFFFLYLQVMTLTLIGIATMFAAIFHIGTKEPPDEVVSSTLSNAVVDIVVSSRIYYNCFIMIIYYNYIGSVREPTIGRWNKTDFLTHSSRK